MAGSAEVALERLKADERLDISSQLQAARLAYFKALDTHEDLDRAKFTCEYYLTEFDVSHVLRLGKPSLLFPVDIYRNRTIESYVNTLFFMRTRSYTQLPTCACKVSEIS
uniref:Uncharacterized protein n=1 Tax=Cryptomonas curvata TaxID=233186 RepID=A0A7S0QG44_9CRYP|mmetsp:Transcript_2561/g.5405  ORF Transcript_2561/g.5405 Transcript_2561/m.5405 type:complete len:110 (+) Transcript_2561:102-431(+)